MSPGARTVIYWLFAAIAAASFARAIPEMPPFGYFRSAYSAFVQHASVPLRHIDNAATAVNFDIRGFDTLGEEFIFFASVAGVMLMFSTAKGSVEVHEETDEGAPIAVKSPATRWFATSLSAFLAAMAVNIAAHTTITPGGGFQGGAVLGSAVACIYLGCGFQAFTRVAKQTLFDSLDSFGAFCYAAMGIATALATGYFLNNVLPLGQIGATVSGGLVQLINGAVFIEIGCGF
ncbi:MAG TPA: MnhB domain-containing protein, partial [Candidatus Baltobacteraceae bacterium]|nr:MnhB domain-containing protein [Candidatus Baltobacteraceae bacterium]